MQTTRNRREQGFMDTFVYVFDLYKTIQVILNNRKKQAFFTIFFLQF